MLAVFSVACAMHDGLSIALEVGACAELVREADVVSRVDVRIHSTAKLPCARRVKRRAEVFPRVEPAGRHIRGSNVRS